MNIDIDRYRYINTHCAPKKTVTQNEFTITFEALKIMSQNLMNLFSN